MPSANDYKYYTLDELNAKIARYDTAISDVLSGAQNYSLDGMSFSRANINFLEDAVNAMRTARAKKTGQGVSQALPVVRRFGC